MLCTVAKRTKSPRLEGLREGPSLDQPVAFDSDALMLWLLSWRPVAFPGVCFLAQSEPQYSLQDSHTIVYPVSVERKLSWGGVH